MSDRCIHCRREIVHEPYFRDARHPNPPRWAHRRGGLTCSEGDVDPGPNEDWPVATPDDDAIARVMAEGTAKERRAKGMDEPDGPMNIELRQGRKVGRTLYEQAGDAPSDGDPVVGMVDTPELAAEICTAVNAAREAAGLAPDFRDRIAAALYQHDPTSHTEGMSAHVRQLAREAADARADAVMGVIGPEITRVALELTSGYETAYRQHQTELMDAGGQVDDLRAEVEQFATELAEERTQHQKAIRDLERTKAVAEHWRFHAVTWPDPLRAAAHPLCMVLAALNGETDPEQLGMTEGDVDAALARARQLAEGAPVDGG